jgi:hypothetical protein
VAAPPGEEHDFSLLLLTVLLRRRGWDVVYLGSNIPLDRLGAAIATTYPRLVISSAQRLCTAADLLTMAQQLHDENASLAFGGRVFNVIPALRDRVPGYFLGETIEAAPSVIGQIIDGAIVPSDGVTHAVSHQQTLGHFHEQLPLIEAQVWQAVQGLSLQHKHVSNANMSMAQGISAALEFGNMSFLNEDINWIRVLLDNHDIHRQVLDDYLATYRDAAAKNLDERGEPIVRWLEDLTNLDAL